MGYTDIQILGAIEKLGLEKLGKLDPKTISAARAVNRAVTKVVAPAAYKKHKYYKAMETTAWRTPKNIRRLDTLLKRSRTGQAEARKAIIERKKNVAGAIGGAGLGYYALRPNKD
jgi:hypothetical protein